MWSSAAAANLLQSLMCYSFLDGLLHTMAGLQQVVVGYFLFGGLFFSFCLFGPFSVNTGMAV